MGTIVIAVCLLSLAGGLVVAVGRRRLGDERHAMRDYHETLETLRRVSGRRAAPDGPRRSRAALASSSAAGTVTARVDPPPRRSPPRRRPEAPASHAGVPPADELRHEDRPAPATPSAAVRELASGRLLPRRSARPRRSMPAPSGRRTCRSPARPVSAGPSRAAVAGVAVLVVTAIAATIGALTSRSSPHVTALHSPSTTVAHRNAASAGRGATTARGLTPARTAAAGGLGIEPLSSTATAAVYQLPTASQPLTVSTDGPCWILATDASGRTLWMGTMQAGQSQTLATGNGLYLRLGAPMHVKVMMGGQPLRFPLGFQSPFDVTFRTA